jgi:HPt (histidine-containing phosphotransfer) domain-containing protein
MDAADPSIDELLAAARSQFAASLPAKVAVIEAHVARGAWDDARRAAHQLRGSAATYGFAALGASAGAIEDALLDVVGAAGPPEPVRARIAGHLDDGKAEAERAAGGSP